MLTTKDNAVRPPKQRELATALGAQVFEAEVNHFGIVTQADHYNQALLQAIAAVRAGKDVKAA